jgi:hypothetical protein
MRAWMLVLVVLPSSAGCITTHLRLNTAQQVSTLTRLQQQIVLDNLAAFRCNPATVPFQANLMSGTSQLVDSGNVGYDSFVKTFFNIGRSVVDQWNLAPVTDEITLRVLSVAYRRALGFEEDLYTYDLANRVAHRLKSQMAAPPDVNVENALMFSRGPALPQLLDRPGWEGDMTLGFRSNDPTVLRWQKDTTDIIATNSDRIIQVGEVVTPETLNVAPALVNGVPVRSEREGVVQVKVATPYAAELRRQVMQLNDYILEINPGWFGWGDKCDIPKCACYVGHHKECNCRCWVWVMPEYQAQFDDFVMRTMYLLTLILEPNMTGVSQGLIYSPVVTR